MREEEGKITAAPSVSLPHTGGRKEKKKRRKEDDDEKERAGKSDGAGTSHVYYHRRLGRDWQTPGPEPARESERFSLLLPSSSHFLSLSPPHSTHTGSAHRERVRVRRDPKTTEEALSHPSDASVDLLLPLSACLSFFPLARSC